MTPEELERRWALLLQPGLIGRPSPRPTAWLVGAQPGAGKSAIAAQIRVMRPDAVEIDGDNFRRAHPDYRHLISSDPFAMPEVTAPACGAWVARSLEFAIEQRADYVLHGTWRDPRTVIAGIVQAQDAGYRVEAVVMAVPASISRLATLQRFYEAIAHGREARWTPRPRTNVP